MARSSAACGLPASGVDLLLAPTAPEQADVVMESHRTSPDSLSHLVQLMRGMYDYTVIDAARSLDDVTIHLFDEADVVYVILTADLSCLKNVQLVLKTTTELGYARDKVQLVLNDPMRSPPSPSRTRKRAGQPHHAPVINEYRGAIGALNSGRRSCSRREPPGAGGERLRDRVDKELSLVEVEADDPGGGPDKPG